MIKAVGLLLLLTSFVSTLHASLVDSSVLESLPAGGRHSCYFVNQNTTRSDQVLLCSATIVSQTQVMLEDSHCWQHVQKRAPRTRVNRNKTQLVCNGAQVSYQFSPRPSAKKAGGLILAQLPQPLPYAGPVINTQADKRAELLNSNKCQVKTATLEGRLGREFLIDAQMKIRHREAGVSPHFAGGHVVCQDENNNDEQTIIAIVGADGKLLFLDQNRALLNLIDKNKHQTAELSLEQRADLLCRETQECLEQVSPEVMNLTSNVLDIVKALHLDLKEKTAPSETEQRQEILTELMNLWREILIACQDAIWKERRSTDSQAQEGYLTGLSGTFERLSISVAEVVSEDFLLNQFSDVDLFTENLTEDQMKEVLKKIEPQTKDLNNIQRVAQSAKALAFEVVKKFLLELNPDMSEEEQNAWIEENAADFAACLESAKSSAMVKECGDKFGETVPALIAKTELDRQTSKNFLSLYTDDQGSVRQSDYQTLKNETTLAFQRCVENYYYTNKTTKAPERARACVYEGLLAGYHHTARGQIQDNFEKTITDPQELEAMVRSSLSQAQDCDYGPLFHRSGRMSEADYQMLSRLGVQEFQAKLEECSQSLTQNVGSLVITQSILNTPEVKENYDENAALTLSQQVLADYYRPCMDRQTRAGNKANPRHCEQMITQLTTLQVAKSLMKNALNKQLEDLGSTALTIDQQNRFKDEIQSLVEDKIDQCHNELKDEFLDSIAAQQENLEQAQRKTLLCVNEGVKIMASRLTTLKLESTFANDPNLSAYGDQILQREDIKTLPALTAQCFSEEIEKLEAVNQLSASLDQISNDCALKTEKQATLMALEVILNERLKENIQDQEDRDKFIREVISEDQGLSTLILTATSAEQLKQTVANIPARVTLRFARGSIPQLINQHLEGKTSAENIERLSQNLIQSLSECIEQYQPPTEQELSGCINRTSAKGHQDILKEMVVLTAKENLQNQEELAQRLARDSQERLKLCLDKVDISKESADYNKELEKCMVFEIGLISRDIPREAILGMTPLLTSRYSPAQLRQQMTKVENFYLQNGDLSGVDDRDPAVGVYMSLNSCLVRVRSDLRRANPSISEAQKEYEVCTSEIEGQIKNTIRRNFVNKSYPGKTSDHVEVLNSAAEILIELTGKQPPTAPGEKAQDPSDVSKTVALLDIVGSSTIVACNYHRRGCVEALAQTKREVLRYKERNPNATSKELEQLFINSPFVELIIESNVSQAMATQLSANLRSFADAEGILAGKIRDITGPAVLGPIMDNRYGQAAKALVKQSILEGKSTDEVVNNPALKASLGMALTQDLGINSFSDQLLHGLVQPVLNQQQRSSNNPGGLFTNPKVTFGRLFGVVKGRDFSWERIRTTPHGQEARRIFAQEILQPVLEGRDITRVPAGNNAKSQQDLAMARIQSLIEEGIKELSR